MVESTGEDFNCGFYFDEEEADKTEGRTYVEMVPASKMGTMAGESISGRLSGVGCKNYIEAKVVRQIWEMRWYQRRMTYKKRLSCLDI